MQHGTSEVASSESGLFFETAYLTNGRVFRRPALCVLPLPLIGTDGWTEQDPIPGTRAERRVRSREAES